MTSPLTTAEELANCVLAAGRSKRRRLVALAGAPASGKSTIAQTLATRLNKDGCVTQIIPMDGFHLHNQILVERGLLSRKGAPETFDARGFLDLVNRLQDETEVYFPTFDRQKDIAIAGGGVILPECDTVIVEGNYLLHDGPVWRELYSHWDLSVRLEAPIDVLEKRLVERWLAHGLSVEKAEARAAENDLINARTVTNTSLPADVIFWPQKRPSQ
jgi:pantothenate kinase